jgi:hypothetical protein
MNDNVLLNARQLAQRFLLRSYDAIHLALAREVKRMLRDIFEGELRFFAFNAGLLKAA